MLTDVKRSMPAVAKPAAVAQRDRRKVSKAEMAAVLEEYRQAEASRKLQGYKYVCPESSCALCDAGEVSHRGA